MVAEHRRAGSRSATPARPVETGRVERVLSETELSEHHLRPEHPEPGYPLVPLPDHAGEDLAAEFGLAHPFGEHTGDAVFEHMRVNPPRPLHDREFVGALLRSDLCRLCVERLYLAEREVFPEAFEQCEGHHLHLEMDRLRACPHPGRGVPVTLHRPDIGEERLVERPLVTPAHPEDGLVATGNQEDSVLHRPGEVELVHPPEDCGSLPRRVLRIHAEPEPLHAIAEFGGGGSLVHTHDWAAMVFGSGGISGDSRRPFRPHGL